MTKAPMGLSTYPPPDEISSRLNLWATELERAVEVLNNTLNEIKSINKKEEPGERTGSSADGV